MNSLLMMSSYFTNKHVLCLCSSPFQAIALVGMFANEANRDFISCDLLIDLSVPDAQNIAKRASSEEVFTHVFCASAQMEENVRHLGSRWILSRSYLRETEKRLFECFPQIKYQRYDVLVCSSVTNVTLALRRYALQGGYSIFFDDGIGSHNGNVYKLFAFQDDIIVSDAAALTMADRLKAVAKSLISKVPMLDRRFGVKALFLFNPTVRDWNLYKNIDIQDISLIDSCDLARRIICPEARPEVYEGLKYVFMTTSKSADVAIRDREVALACRLSDLLGDAMGIRLHPNRDADDFRQCAKALLPTGDSWELLLIDKAISEEAYLLGLGSSTQFHPKSIFGMEPRVVFLYNILIDGESASSLASIEQLVEHLRDDYDHRERIAVPDSYESLLEFIGIA